MPIPATKRVRHGLLSTRSGNFGAGILVIILPFVLFTGITHYLMVHTMDRFQGVMDRTVEIMLPTFALQGALARALMPAHDYLIHDSPDQRERLARASKRVEQLLDEVAAHEAGWDKDRALIGEARAAWESAHGLGLEIVNTPRSPSEADNSAVMADLDQRMDRAHTALDRLLDAALTALGHQWAESRDNNRVQIVTTGLLAALVIGLAVAAGQVVVRMGRAIQESEARFSHLARHDPLTGLENRQEFHLRLEEELERARRFGRPCALIMLDVDHFKAINDTHGHPAGDEALRRIAAVLCRQVRRIDHVVRYGGEEFVILLPETGAEGAEALAERIRAAVSAHPTPLGRDLEQRITASLGVATYPADADGAADLVRAADLALYAAKRAGRDRVARAAGAAAPRV